MPNESITPLSRRRFVEVASAGIAGTFLNSCSETPTETLSKLDKAYPLLTPADEFYDVSRGTPTPHSLKGEALINARLTPEAWRLEIVGDETVDLPRFDKATKLENAFTIESGNAIDFSKLLEMEKTAGVKYIKALQCLNIAEPLGQGLWEGVLLRDVLRLCGKMENVRRIRYEGFHNDDPTQLFQSSVSYTEAMETAPGDLPVMLAFRLNGKPLSLERGGPVRMIVPWAHGFKSIKWLQRITLTNNYQNNDTYALKNNHADSLLKTAAYIDGGPKEIQSGKSITINGLVMSGVSGVERVETWIRTIEGKDTTLRGHSPELLAGDWNPATIQSPPNWITTLPEGIKPHDLLGFDSDSGKPTSWPMSYCTAAWSATYRDLSPGTYRIYARSVDKNGFAQPEPRPVWKSGDNMVKSHKVKVV